ncbi:cytochrome b/b6 domain-containing protein [Ostreibacterium oceani]|uniref:Cytochrome b561 bacterial/Ni-hydrogenase domain-containing protein n=1 Tax=Ostreibacterium oceani TaxID=2654998 RepID=A0A6N7EZM8_9GAMM|nr:cytochrome b/b6 domain-containing protein [Ostreibacterium oceani]MPV86975.1 hypothetical protein [Ostreibacterium oceani]
MNLFKKMASRQQNIAAHDINFPLLAKLIHWLVAIGVVVNLWISQPESKLHENVGFIIGFAVLLRIVLIGILGGPKLTINPRIIWQDFRAIKNREKIHSRYTPLGGWMIWLLWVVLLLTVATGYLGYEYGYDYDWAYALMGWHKTLAEILPYLIATHVVAVVFLSFWSKTHLVKRMIHR